MLDGRRGSTTGARTASTPPLNRIACRSSSPRSQHVAQPRDDCRDENRDGELPGPKSTSRFADCQSRSRAVASGATTCAVTPDGRWSGRPESNRRRSAWEFPYGGPTKYHFPSESITSSRGREPQVSRPMTPSHGIWAASWVAETGCRVMAKTCFIAPLGVSRFHRALVVSWHGRSLRCISLRYSVSGPAVWTCLAQLPSSYYTLRYEDPHRAIARGTGG